MKQKILFFFISSLWFSIILAPMATGPFIPFLSAAYIGLRLGCLCGLVFTLLNIYIQWFYLKKAGLNKTGISVVNSIEIEAEGNKEEIFAFCLESLRSIRRSELGLLNKDKGIFTVNIKWNWRTWGDLIQFEVKEIRGNQKCNVIITSRPAMGTVLVDFSKNLDNVIKITNYLKSKSPLKVLANGCNIIK